MVLQSIVRTGKGRERAAISIFVFALVSVLVGLPRVACAVPSFATQTGLPCAQCHVMAFGPQLTEYGRQFKLNGYTFRRQDGGLSIPLAATVIAGYENISKAAPNPAPYSDKENLALQNVSVYFAGASPTTSVHSSRRPTTTSSKAPPGTSWMCGTRAPWISAATAPSSGSM
jgi:hypothetical protein